VEKLVDGLKCLKNEARAEDAGPEPASTASASAQERSVGKLPSWQPETLFRTCLSSLASSEEFESMMAAEADARGFFTAEKRAFVGDGLGYNTAAKYLTNNRSRMDYPRYRRSGLPVTSSLAESLVKQVSKRVKGTEKFWNDGPSGEAILQMRAAVISDDDRLQKWIRNRPVSPVSPRCRRILQANSA
jgi:hypothetical protein